MKRYRMKISCAPLRSRKPKSTFGKPIVSMAKGGPADGNAVYTHGDHATMTFRLGSWIGRYVGGNWEQA